MFSFDDRIKLDIYKDETTYRNDYKRYENATKAVLNNKRPKCEQVERIVRKIPQRDTETFQNWHEHVYVPHNLFWKPRPILDENPHIPYPQNLPEIDDPERENAIKTRPRIYMSPAVSMDDIEQEEMRKVILKHMYTTEWGLASAEAVQGTNGRNIKKTTLEPPGDPVKFRMDLIQPLPKNFRNLGIKWESAQFRAEMDPTRTFWLNKDPLALEDPTKDLLPDDKKCEIHNLILQNKLRLPHDQPVSGYAGNIPMSSEGVPLCKTNFDVTHPFMSSAEVISKRFQGDYTSK